MNATLSRTAERFIIATSLACYAALLAYAIPRHEPWADEAQAWELATSLSLRKLFGTFIHYECTPGLWHFLLWLLWKMHLSYAGMHWVAGIIGFSAMALLALASPFPLLIRILLPFSFFFVYQYAVIARSYTLCPVLLFAMALLWKQRWKRPLPAALLIGALANTSLHGLAVSCGLAIVLVLEAYRLQKQERDGRDLRFAAALLSGMLGFAIWSIWPSPDAGWAVVVQRTHSNVYGLTDMVGRSYQFHPWLHLIRLRYSVFLGLLFNFTQALGRGFMDRFSLGLVAWALLVWDLARRQLLRYILPVAFLAVVSPPIFSQIYHAGLMWVLFLSLLWVTWPQRPAATWAWYRHSAVGRRHAAILAVLAICVTIQLEWGIAALRYDATMQYSPDRSGAAVLQSYVSRGYKVDVAVPSRMKADGNGPFYAVGLEPYFASQPIGNMPYRFWFLGEDAGVREQYLHAVDDHAAVILVEETDDDPRYRMEEAWLQAKQYRRESSVCGWMFHMNRAPVCHAFYRPQMQEGSLP